jgi:hypothetical protein
MHVPVDIFRAVNSQRAVPPLMAPQAKHFSVRVAFAAEDLQAAERAMACHRSQFTAELIQRVLPTYVAAWNGAIPFVPAFPTGGGTDLFE